jgi:hypothetical protein
MSDEVTTHQIQGVCEGVMMKGDWQEFHIGIGKQYPVKLSTKQDDIKALAAAAGANVAIWTYTERQGGPNPHRPGEFFKNRYLSNVEVGGTLDPALAAQQTIPSTSTATGGGAHHPPSPEGREVSIERQTIVKAVLASDWKFTDEDQLFVLLDRLDDWMARERPKAEATEKPAEERPAETAPPAVDPDDDIPF